MSRKERQGFEAAVRAFFEQGDLTVRVDGQDVRWTDASNRTVTIRYIPARALRPHVWYGPSLEITLERPGKQTRDVGRLSFGMRVNLKRRWRSALVAAGVDPQL